MHCIRHVGTTMNFIHKLADENSARVQVGGTSAAKEPAGAREAE